MMHFHCIKASQIAILHAGLFTCQSCTMISFQSFRCHLHKMKQNPSGAEATNRVNSVHTGRRKPQPSKNPTKLSCYQNDKKYSFSKMIWPYCLQSCIRLEIAILCSSKTMAWTRRHSLHHTNHNRCRDISIYCHIASNSTLGIREILSLIQ